MFAHITSNGEQGFTRAHAVVLATLDRDFGKRLTAGEADVITTALSRLG